MIRLPQPTRARRKDAFSHRLENAMSARLLFAAALVVAIATSLPGAPASAQEQLEAMRETTDRMVADRQQREKHRAELRQLQAEKTRQTQVIEYSEPTDYSYSRSGVYSGYYPYPVYRPGAGHRPRPPIARPPMRPRPPAHLPAQRVISPGHDYPASLIRKSYSPPVRAAFEH